MKYDAECDYGFGAVFFQNGLHTGSCCFGKQGFGCKFSIGDIAFPDGEGVKSLPELYPLSDTGE